MASTAHRHELSVRAWQELVDPPGHRLEIVGGELVVAPSGSPEHGGAIGELFVALRPNVPADHRLVIDVEWRWDERGTVAMAPRPDLMVMPRQLDDHWVPLLTVEVLSDSDHHRLERSPHTRIEGKRLDYAAHGVEHHLEVDLANQALHRYQRNAGRLEVIDSAGGDQLTLMSREPFPYEIDVAALFA